MMLLQHAATAGAHPLSGTAASYVWLLPLLPLLGFVLNGLLSITAAYKGGPDDPSASHHDEAGPSLHSGRHDGVAHSSHDDGHDDHHAVVRHKHAGLVSLIGPGVLALSFVLAIAIFVAMLGAGEMHTPFIQTYFSWMPVGDL